MDGPKEACDGCGADLTWVDAADLCPDGCTYCSDCSEDRGGQCLLCSEPLRRSRRTRPVGRPAPPRKPAGYD